MAEIAATGLRWVRLDAFWAYIETAEGVYSWADLDLGISNLVAAGLTPLVVIHTTPAWARPAGAPDAVTCGAVGDVAVRGYARFCAAVASRYAGKLGAIELWNEANLVQFWRPTPSVADYLRAASAASHAIRQVDRTLPIISQGIGGAGNAPDIHINTWMAEFYALNGARWFDGIGVHHYSQTGEVWAVDRVLAAMEAAGDSRPVWLTEAGAPTSATGSAYAGGWAVTEQKQREVVERMCGEFQRKCPDGVLALFSWSDNPNLADDDREAHFGIARTRTAARKPAADTLEAEAVEAAFTPAIRGGAA